MSDRKRIAALVQENIHRAAALIHEAALMAFDDFPPGMTPLTKQQRETAVMHLGLIAAHKAQALEILRGRDELAK